MMGFWQFLSNPANQATLTWIGGGVIVVAGGIWAVIQFWAQKPRDPSGPKPSVSSSGGSVAIGGDASNSKINIRK